LLVQQDPGLVPRLPVLPVQSWILKSRGEQV
jgi:hypothetical protein